MSTAPDPAPPKKGAASCDAASSGEREIDSTAGTDAQGNPALELTKLFMRCEPKARREFLSDVRAAHPQLWEQVSKEEV